MGFRYNVEVREGKDVVSSAVVDDLSQATQFATDEGIAGDVVVVSEGYVNSFGDLDITDHVASWVL